MAFLNRMVRAAKLDKTLYEEVEADTGATLQAMLVVVLASVAGGIGSLGASMVSPITSVIGSLVSWVLFAGVIYLVGTKILAEPQTEADMGQLLRTLGFAQAPGILAIAGIVPILGWAVAFGAGIWVLVATVIAVRQALDYTGTGRAVVVCLIGAFIFMAARIAIVMMTGGAI